jgi:hypothetical protein
VCVCVCVYVCVLGGGGGGCRRSPPSRLKSTQRGSAVDLANDPPFHSRAFAKVVKLFLADLLTAASVLAVPR